MRDLTVERLHEILGGRLRFAARMPQAGEQTRIGHVVTDSRQIQPGDVFWALSGTHLDGADFAPEAYRRGASGVVVGGRYVQPWPGCWSLEVQQAQQALHKLAQWNRSRMQGVVIGVTGSVGKTTTRQLISAALGSRLTGSSSPKNYNNHVGLPLSMLLIEPDHDYAVLELAASAPGEIADLAQLCQPKIGVLTRIGEAHLASFGGHHALAKAKTELLESLPADGWAVLSGDDPWLRRNATRCGAKVVWVGRSLDCDVIATDVLCQSGALSFCVAGRRIEVPIWGRHHLNSTLAAVAVGQILGLSLEDIADGLANFEGPPMRCQIQHLRGATIINDSYNSSPSAMHAALELLRDFDAPGQRIVVCGDMRELGDATTRLHDRLGNEVVTLCGADLLLACGEHADEVVAAAVRAGMPSSRTAVFRAAVDALPQLEAALAPGDVVLIKGSRALAMERLVAALEARRQPTPIGQHHSASRAT